VKAQSLLDTIQTWGSVVKFSHTIFALPFAVSIFVILMSRQDVLMVDIFAIFLCLISARTAAMAFNRLIDRDVDAKNPRTAVRELPSGRISSMSVWLLLGFSTGAFFAGCAVLGTHCLVVAPAVLGVLFFYSLTKRFTKYSHLVLGVSLALAPGGVWYALTGRADLSPLLLMFAVMFWVAGFDIIYACQDVAFDREEGLFSLPAKLGISKSLVVSRTCHVAAVALLFLFGYAMVLGPFSRIGVLIFALLIGSQHLIVSKDDLSRVDAAFFTRNGIASVVFFLGTLLDVLV
jgi:4-hydroxybenzoate polyprenyltransferase